MTWTVETLNDIVDAELSALPNDMKAKLVWISNLIEIKLALKRESRDSIMTLVSDLHQDWLKDPEYQAAYEAQRPEFEVASAIIAARAAANLTQKELADLMSAKQSLIARLEAGEQNTTIKTLNRIAKATNTRLHISFLPQD